MNSLFNLKLAKEGNEIQTLSGYEVNILKWDVKSDYPLIGLIKKDDEEIVISYNERGEPDGFDNNYTLYKDFKLVMVSHETKFYYGIVELGKNRYDTTSLYNSLDDLENYVKSENLKLIQFHIFDTNTI